MHFSILILHLSTHIYVLMFFSVPTLPPQRKPARRRYENYGMYSDDDANSDASSACSERSYSSRNGGAIPTYMRQTEDVAEVGGYSSAASWQSIHNKKSKNKSQFTSLKSLIILDLCLFAQFNLVQP